MVLNYTMDSICVGKRVIDHLSLFPLCILCDAYLTGYDWLIMYLLLL